MGARGPRCRRHRRWSGRVPWASTVTQTARGVGRSDAGECHLRVTRRAHTPGRQYKLHGGAAQNTLRRRGVWIDKMPARHHRTSETCTDAAVALTTVATTPFCPIITNGSTVGRSRRHSVSEQRVDRPVSPGETGWSREYLRTYTIGQFDRSAGVSVDFGQATMF